MNGRRALSILFAIGIVLVGFQAISDVMRDQGLLLSIRIPVVVCVVAAVLVMVNSLLRRQP